jgi:hypothetical protein
MGRRRAIGGDWPALMPEALEWSRSSVLVNPIADVAAMRERRSRIERKHCTRTLRRKFLV